MATFLYRLGRFSFRRRRLVALVWAALVVLCGVGAATLHGQTSDDFSVPGTESQRAIDLLKDKMPQANADGATASMVFAAGPGGTLTSGPARDAVERAVAALRTSPQVASVADPYAARAVSPDGRTAHAEVAYKVVPIDVTDQAREALTAVAAQARSTGLTVETRGTATQATPEQSATEVIGVAVAAVVLFITFGSLIAAGLPLLNAILGVAIAMSLITAATGFLDMSSFTSTLALMLGLAVAIDYSLFIVSRYRHEIAEGREPAEAAGRAVGTAGSAVVFAGLTVVIALAGLSVVGLPVLTQMGLAAAVAVVVAVLIALSLLPALLGFGGRRVARAGSRLVRGGPRPGRAPAGERWARFVLRRPLPVLLLAVLGLGVVAVPTLDLRLGLPGDEVAAPSTTQRKAYDMLSDGFGPGFNGPLLVLVEGTGVKARAEAFAGELRTLPDVKVVSRPAVNTARDTALLTVVPRSGPSEDGTEKLVGAIRDRAAASGTDAMVTGQTAMNIDISAKMSGALVPYLAVVVGLAFLLLLLVFRSIMVPLKATAGFLLTVLATFGAVVAVFQWGWLDGLLGVETTGPIMSLMPIFMIGVVFGLAMDYQVFLVTRMREEYVHGASPHEAVAVGFRHGARVVTAAAVIMIAVFAGFLASDETMIKLMGFALSAGVLFDAFVVRMTIVPAAMALAGRAAWWLPRWLDRLLPNVDVEGERLRHRLAADPGREPAAVGT
ncbi:MMPL family transporter [Actinomadura rayongensis]|uniref:MMPL family transporter n=1 Tax=Actinomadura rayongensis TaxID=1429076 RepID=A0A6I4WC12_9ACTN|nr:MMPL family transporter [Actinomadura rayongensis]MXQ67121.1 MMPL family transporter [Actinomadura rayongensis]